MSKFLWRATVLLIKDSEEVVTVRGPVLVVGDDEADATRALGTKILSDYNAPGGNLLSLARNLVNGVPYFYSFSIMMENLGKARFGIQTAN